MVRSYALVNGTYLWLPDMETPIYRFPSATASLNWDNEMGINPIS